MQGLSKLNPNGELLTVNQTASESNLGIATVRMIAEESGAVRRFGRAYRIHRKTFFDYIEEHCRE